ncbi:MAG: glycosyltransferase [Planctomycetota bacterium]
MNDAHERKVLMICHAFPPTGGSGVQRSAKFAKYLPEFGWLPIVWTADAVDGLPSDPTLSNDLPREVVVHAHRAGGGVQAYRRSLRGFVDAGDGARLRAAASQVARAIDWRLQSWLASAPFPDDCAAWARRSVRPLMRMVEGDGIELLYSTYRPASNHLLALELKRRTGLPWVADFRDLWTDDYRYREPSARRRAAHRKLEQEILDSADVVVGVTPTQTEILAAHVPSAQAKFVTITNGFDPADFEESLTAPEGHRNDFVLAYVGRLDAQRTDAALGDGLRAFADGLGADRERVLFRLVGHVNAVARERIASTGLRCEFHDYVPHAEAIRTMREADALLLIAPTGPNCETVIAANVFEYLAARRPIVLVGPRGGECERIVRSCRAGVVAPFESGPIDAALTRVFGAWKIGRPLRGCNPSRLGVYSRVELTRSLAAVFDRLIDERDAPLPTDASLLETIAP